MGSFEKARVVNINDSAYDQYVGRTGQRVEGIFGNPFRAGTHGTHEQVIAKFRQHLRNRVSIDHDFLGAVLALRGKRLGCFCAPKRCHGDEIAAFVNEVEERAVNAPAVGQPFWNGCSICSVLMYTQMPNRHAACAKCGRWYCPTHLPEKVHACPAVTR